MKVRNSSFMVVFFFVILIFKTSSLLAAAAVGDTGATVIEDISRDTPTRRLFNNCLDTLVSRSDAYRRLIHEARDDRIFISYARGDAAHTKWVEALCYDLEKAGYSEANIRFDEWTTDRPGSAGDMFNHLEEITAASKILVIGSPSLKEKYERRTSGGDLELDRSNPEISALQVRMRTRGNLGIIPVFYDLRATDVLPIGLQHLRPRALKGEEYFSSFFELLQDLLHARFPSVGVTIRENPIRSKAEEFEHLKGAAALHLPGAIPPAGADEEML